MTSKLTRAFLQAMPERNKQQFIEARIDNAVTEIQRAALRGRTSYTYDPNKPVTPGLTISDSPPRPTVTMDEWVAAFKRKFPDLTISYKDGILVDWS